MRDYRRPMDPRANIFRLQSPRFFLKPEYTMKQYKAASYFERKKMIDWSNTKWNEWCQLWNQIETILIRTNGDWSKVPNELHDKFMGYDIHGIHSISDLLNE
ncbi:hypothetical protein [Hungatella hathewayi]|uniref:hypothetical protein n=1 Tax=Hungatella hathewayi TaxID=154046 RepID=UPI003564B962